MIHKLSLENKKTKGFVYNKYFYVLKAIFGSKKYKHHEKKIITQIEKTSYILPYKRDKKTLQIYDLSKVIDELLMIKIDISELASIILEDVGIYENNNMYWQYMQGILSKLIFNLEPTFEASQFPEYKYDNEQNPKELWIKIHPWTTKKVYESYFPTLAFLKSKLENNTHKVKPWETFERDLALYKLYLRVKSDIENDVIKGEVITAHRGSTSKSIYEQLLHSQEYQKLKREYHHQLIDESSVQRIIKDTRLKLDSLQLI